MRAIQRRAEPIEQQIGQGNLEQEICEEEHAGAEAEHRLADTEIRVHRQLGEADLVEIGDEVADDEKGYELPAGVVVRCSMSIFVSPRSARLLSERRRACPSRLWLRGNYCGHPISSHTFAPMSPCLTSDSPTRIAPAPHFFNRSTSAREWMPLSATSKGEDGELRMEDGSDVFAIFNLPSSILAANRSVVARSTLKVFKLRLFTPMSAGEIFSARSNSSSS